MDDPNLICSVFIPNENDKYLENLIKLAKKHKALKFTKSKTGNATEYFFHFSNQDDKNIFFDNIEIKWTESVYKKGG